MRRCLLVLLNLVLLTLFSLPVLAAEKFTIVTDPWPPYVYSEQGKPVGTDVEVSISILKRLGIDAHIELLPWKRSLALVERKEADAILAASRTAERDEFLFFPNEAVSTGVTVFFQRADQTLQTIDLENPSKLKVGTINGYSYCTELDNSRLIKQSSRVASLEQNFNKLLLGRIDLLVEVGAVGLYSAKSMGISDRIKMIPNARYCAGGNYLAFSKKAGYDDLAKRFGDELARFKKTAEYQAIIGKYGLRSY